MENIQISIIIPHYNRNDLTDRLVESLKKYCSGDLQIIVVDDCSAIPYVNQKVTVALGQKNEGFLKTCNAGLEIASGDIKVLISNDVLVTGDFIPQLLGKIEEFPSALVGNRLINFDSGWNKFDGKIFSYLEGWFLAASAEVWNKLGGFDERYSPNDYEDNDLSTTAYSLGFPVISLDSPYLKHLGAQTLKYSPEREVITIANREKFRAKWCSALINVEGK
jgi:GT2 family glycosyltransferase